MRCLVCDRPAGAAAEPDNRSQLRVADPEVALLSPASAPAILGDEVLAGIVIAHDDDSMKAGQIATTGIRIDAARVTKEIHIDRHRGHQRPVSDKLALEYIRGSVGTRVVDPVPVLDLICRTGGAAATGPSVWKAGFGRQTRVANVVCCIVYITAAATTRVAAGDQHLLREIKIGIGLTRCYEGRRFECTR